jgi:hypothetical protein
MAVEKSDASSQATTDYVFSALKTESVASLRAQLELA